MWASGHTGTLHQPNTVGETEESQGIHVQVWQAWNTCKDAKGRLALAGYDTYENYVTSRITIKVALPIDDRERNLGKSFLAGVCTLNVYGYSKLLRSEQWKVHKNTVLKQDILLLCSGTNLHEYLEWPEICP